MVVHILRAVRLRLEKARERASEGARVKWRSDVYGNMKCELTGAKLNARSLIKGACNKLDHNKLQFFWSIWFWTDGKFQL